MYIIIRMVKSYNKKVKVGGEGEGGNTQQIYNQPEYKQSVNAYTKWFDSKTQSGAPDNTEYEKYINMVYIRPDINNTLPTTPDKRHEILEGKVPTLIIEMDELIKQIKKVPNKFKGEEKNIDERENAKKKLSAVLRLLNEYIDYYDTKEIYKYLTSDEVNNEIKIEKKEIPVINYLGKKLILNEGNQIQNTRYYTTIFEEIENEKEAYLSKIKAYSAENVIFVMPCLNEIQQFGGLSEAIGSETENREGLINDSCTDVSEINCSSKDVCNRNNTPCYKDGLLTYLPYFDKNCKANCDDYTDGNFWNECIAHLNEICGEDKCNVIMVTHHNRMRKKILKFKDAGEGKNTKTPAYANCCCIKFKGGSIETPKLVFKGYPDKYKEYSYLGINNEKSGGEKDELKITEKNIVKLDLRQLNKNITLYVIRHGNSMHNQPVKSVLNSSKLDSTLTPLGIYQATQLGKKIKEDIGKEEDRIVLVSSYLQRTQHTALTIINEIKPIKEEPDDNKIFSQKINCFDKLSFHRTTYEGIIKLREETKKKILNTILKNNKIDTDFQKNFEKFLNTFESNFNPLKRGSKLNKNNITTREKARANLNQKNISERAEERAKLKKQQTKNKQLKKWLMEINTVNRNRPQTAGNRNTKKLSTKKLSTKKRNTKKLSTKNRNTKKLSTKKRNTKNRNTKKRK